jgi:cell division protein FtsI (penicillin-binding protein 3)
MAARREKRARQARRADRALPSYVGRRRAVVGLFVIAASALVWGAFERQILEKDFLQSEGADRYLARVEVPAHRGLITDRRGDVLALSTPVDSIAANPRVLPNDAATLILLGRALERDPDSLRSLLARHSRQHFVYLRRGMPPAEAARVMELVAEHGIPGVHSVPEHKRYYPAGEVLAHLIGFTDVDDRPLEGLERAFDEVLRGEHGAKLVLRDGRRQVVNDVENIRSPRAGNHLALSIDQRLQFIAYRELKAAARRHRAIGGSLVLLDARSGEILALVNQPSFNPNGDRSNRGGRLRNRAFTDLFEPGSTLKPFTVAAALDQGTIRPDSVIDTSPGWFRIGGAQVKDSRNLGAIDVRTVLGKSSNVGVSRIALDLERRALWQVMDRLGFGQGTGSGFPGEAAGLLNDYRRWATIDHATLAFGYGISVTAVQLAQAYVALANDGVLLPLSLLKRDAAPSGNRVFKASTAVAVRRMLESALEEGGTATAAAVTGYRVAGKTGTVRKFGPDGYSEDRYQALFAGMAPARDPRFVMVGMLDEPQGDAYYGGQVAAPVFSAVMAEALRLMNVAPELGEAPALRLAQAGGGR